MAGPTVLRNALDWTSVTGRTGPPHGGPLVATATSDQFHLLNSLSGADVGRPIRRLAAGVPRRKDEADLVQVPAELSLCDWLSGNRMTD